MFACYLKKTLLVDWEDISYICMSNKGSDCAAQTRTCWSTRIDILLGAMFLFKKKQG